MTDIDTLLSRTAPTVTSAGDVGDAMGATARSIATTSRQRRSAGRRTGAFVLGTAAALAAAALVVSGHDGPPRTTKTTAGLTQLQLLAAKSAPVGLPLPEGVTIDDAKAFVTTLVQNNPGLQAGPRTPLTTASS